MNTLIRKQYIRSIELKKENIDLYDKYPFCLPAVKDIGAIKFHPKVTFIIGKNGTGKSTVLEAIAAAYGFNPEGGTKNFSFATRASHSKLYEYIRLVKGIKKPKDGFFLRAESFYNLATAIEELDKEGIGPRLIDSYGGISLHEKSHGELFFSVFMSRLGGAGLYILDEPEAALSPTRQMSMISRMHELTNMDSQFIIATHSAILLAYPYSSIYEISDTGFKKVHYEETEHYVITKSFLNNTKNMLDILLQDADSED